MDSRITRVFKPDNEEQSLFKQVAILLLEDPLPDEYIAKVLALILKWEKRFNETKRALAGWEISHYHPPGSPKGEIITSDVDDGWVNYDFDV